MPRGEYANTEKLAVKIVRDAELARGWKPRPLLGQHAQHEEGCDLFSTPPHGTHPHRIEVKGWGEPLLAPDGAFTCPADVNREQYERAKSDPNWRLEIVANLAAVRAGTGKPERLTLTGEEVVRRAEYWRYRIPLDGLAESISNVT